MGRASRLSIKKTGKMPVATELSSFSDKAFENHYKSLWMPIAIKRIAGPSVRPSRVPPVARTQAYHHSVGRSARLQV